MALIVFSLMVLGICAFLLASRHRPSFQEVNRNTLPRWKAGED